MPRALSHAANECKEEIGLYAVVVVNLGERRVHRSGTDSRKGVGGGGGEGRGSLHLTVTLSPPE